MLLVVVCIDSHGHVVAEGEDKGAEGIGGIVRKLKRNGSGGRDKGKMKRGTGEAG